MRREVCERGGLEKMGKKLEGLKMVVRGEVPEAPIWQLIGFKTVAISEGESVLEIETSSRHTNPMGTLHGGVLCDVSDAAMGMAFASTLADDESFTTLELKINFLRPVWTDKLRATGKVVKRGRHVGMVECDVRNSKGDLVAKSTSTCMVLRGELAVGRETPSA
jgi:uncharacterized protein (TIGR00369 family)